MREKVYINRVETDYIADFARARDYFHRHGVEINFEFVQSDYANLSYTKMQFPQGERIILEPHMASIVPADPAYDFISFVFNGQEFTPPDIPTSFCYVASDITGQPFMDISTDPRNPADLDYVNICHEHMHALVIKARRAGFAVPDVMDTYYNHMHLEDADSNFGQQWALLQDYVKSLQKPLASAKKIIPKAKTTIKLKKPLVKKLPQKSATPKKKVVKSKPKNFN